MSGRVPGHGIWEANPKMTDAVGLNANMSLLPAQLRLAGYSTHHVGKW